MTSGLGMGMMVVVPAKASLPFGESGTASITVTLSAGTGHKYHDLACRQYRSGLNASNARLGFTALSVLLVLALVMPYARGAWIREAAVIVVFFPFLVALGAGAMVTPRIERLCRVSGDLSYPLYMTHLRCVIWIWATTRKDINSDRWPLACDSARRLHHGCVRLGRL
jgi:peptidoglycan/LPS O-acetylase OafA/YrhL